LGIENACNLLFYLTTQEVFWCFQNAFEDFWGKAIAWLSDPGCGPEQLQVFHSKQGIAMHCPNMQLHICAAMKLCSALHFSDSLHFIHMIFYCPKNQQLH